jgi:hypothetical protein
VAVVAEATVLRVVQVELHFLVDQEVLVVFLEQLEQLVTVA